MKSAYCLLSFILLISCVSATIEERQKQDIVEFPGITKNQIFSKSLQWIALTFKSGNSVIQYQNKEEGKIIGNITTTYQVLISTVYVRSSMTIDIKDYKARITYLPNTVLIEGTTREIYGETEVNDIKKSLIPITDSYKSFIQGKTKDSNW